jgi:hypothetical protein
LITARFFERGPGRFNTALGFSLLAHALLLSIAFGGQTFGLPGLNLPWEERRLGADALQVLLAPARPAAAPAPPEPSPPEMPGAVLPALEKAAVGRTEAASVAMPSAAPAPTPAPTPPAPPQERAAPPPVGFQAGEIPAPSHAADAAQELALEQARLERERQSAERLRQAALMAAAQREEARQEQLRQDARAEQTARSEAARVETERQERLRQESLQREQARQQEEKAQQEAARQELARTEAARLDAARRDAARQEQARQAQLEAARQEAIRQEGARRDAAKQEAARQEARDAPRREAAQQEQAKQELAQRERADQEAKREERLRAIGKQLAEEAAQRDAASNTPSRSLLPTVSSLRRGWLFGRADANNDLVLYAEAMSRKIELNMTFDMVRAAVKQPHVRPMVTVALRADGSVEKVTFVVSSGVAAIDEAIRKVVASQAPYAAFPPAIARQYDVIEIRRTWIFDTAIRLE